MNPPYIGTPDMTPEFVLVASAAIGLVLVLIEVVRAWRRRRDEHD